MKKTTLFFVIFFTSLIIISAIFTAFLKEMPKDNKIALVKVEGAIIDAKPIVEEIKGYVKDRSIKAILLRINSPGGGVTPSQEIFAEVKRAASVKNVVVSMGAIAASGGYYIAAPATKIIANPGTITGSIGVIIEIPNLKELMDKIGIKTEVIKSGKHKDMASVFRGIGKDEREILQSLINDVHEQFIHDVVESRKIPKENIYKIADAKVFSGRQALAIGLVDELGDLQHAIKVAASLSGIEGEPEIVTKKKKPPLLELLEGESNLTDFLQRLLPPLELKYKFVPDGGIQ
ncbi:MAG: signal peptide peptidase SppA [Thermodesulfovibrionales bacterium]|nr:signal peptide peptidase SppA [Thermodesulfovibrionales bacterium]